MALEIPTNLKNKQLDRNFLIETYIHGEDYILNLISFDLLTITSSKELHSFDQ